MNFKAALNPLYTALSIIAVCVLMLVIVYRALITERSLEKRTDTLQQLVVDSRQTVETMRTTILENLHSANARSDTNAEILKSLQTQITGVTTRLDKTDSNAEILKNLQAQITSIGARIDKLNDRLMLSESSKHGDKSE